LRRQEINGTSHSFGQMEAYLKAVENFECDEMGSNVLESIKRLSWITNMI